MSFRISNSSAFSIARNFNPVPPVEEKVVEVPKHWVSDWMELLLKKIATNKLGPTMTSRWLFIAGNALYNSYQFVTADKYPLDMLYWKSNKKGNLYRENDILLLESWMDLSCRYFFPKLIREYMNLTLTDSEISTIVNSHNLVPLKNDSFDSLKQLLDEYLIARDNDGWKQTMTFNGILPNGSNKIYADQSQDQNLSSLPEPNKWTPLSINGVTKNYLTPEWGTVNKGLLNDNEFNEVLEKTNVLFPNDSQFEKEMKEVEQITSNLTDEQKMIAEFWAGGPGTVTPPGMWVVFMDIVIRSNSLGLVTEIKNYAVICSGIYQSSICAWRLKRDHLQARPIQKIRQYENGKEIHQSWNEKTLGQYWLPYQELNFVTPPFPDFVSGHSTFSSSSAKLFCYLLGSDIITLKNPVINNDIINYLCPSLTNTLNFSLNNFFIMPSTSLVENGVPSTSMHFNWICWTEMARSSGKSRIYGGIHVESSNQGGLYLGTMIADKLWKTFSNL
jgi:hypothetical protein